MNKVLLFTLLAAVIIVGTLQLGNLTFAQTPPIKEKIIRPDALGLTNLWAESTPLNNKVADVTDGVPTTYITSNVNNQGQNFKYTHGLYANTQIVEVLEKWKGYKTNPSGTTKVRSFVQVGSTSYNDLTDYPLPLYPTISEFTKSYLKNPTNKQNWTRDSFAAASIGWKQATATKPSFITEAWIVLRVIDGSPPVISGVPANIGPVSPSSPAGAVVTWPPIPNAVDDVDVAGIPVTCIPPSGYTFQVGVTTVSCTATDSSGNIAPASFTVTVIDNIPPVITAPSPITVEATAEFTPLADVNLGTATATDNVDPSPVITNNAPATFPLGDTTVTWTATDFSANSATAPQLVTLVDTTDPILTLPADITRAAGSPVVVTFDVTATDTVDSSPVVVCIPPSGSLFDVGENIVSCTATDASGNQASGSFKIHVFDVASSANTVTVGGAFYIQVTDTGATGPVFVTVASPPNDPTNSIQVELAATGNGIFINVLNPILPVLTSSGAPNEIVIPSAGFDDISVTYSRDEESKTITVESSDLANSEGRPVTANDPVRWSSDRYVIESSGHVKVFVGGSYVGGSLATISASVESSAVTGSPQSSVTLVEDSANIGTFTTQYAITFTNTSPSNFDNPATPRLYAPVGATVTARYPAGSTAAGTFSVATIDSSTIPTFGAVTAAAANLACGTGGDDDFDGICDTWETQVTGHNGIRVTSGGQLYTYVCSRQIDDTATGSNTGPYSAHGTASPITINPGTGSGNSGGFFTTTNGCPNPLIRDLYIELDYMAGHKPTRAALAQFIVAMANVADPDGNGSIAPGIKAHIQLDENFGFHRDQIPYDDTTSAGVVAYDVDQIKSAKFGKSAERSGKTGTVLSAYLGAKSQVFHWVASIHNLVDRVGQSGYGEITGNDAVISLGSFTGNIGTDAEYGATLFHEEGHNMGLDHQGPSAVAPNPINCAPNYLSAMNYLFQFNDIVNDRPLKYSQSALSTLNEITGLSESAGLSQAPTGWRSAYGPVTGSAPFTGILTTSALSAASNSVDWNRNDVFSGSAQLAVHYIPGIGCNDSTLRNLVSQVDTLVMNFRSHTSNFADGIHTSLTYSPDRGVTAGFDPSGDAVHNAPFVKTITVPTAVAVNTALTLAGSIEDPGESGETHTVTINWGDGTSSPPIPLSSLPPEPDDETIRANIPSTTHTYTSVGKYTISVTVTDSTNLSDTSAFPAYVLVYGTSGRLVSTSSVNTPAGAFKADSSFTGVASFSFQPDWRNNAVPTGQFHLDLSNGALHVDGTVFEWLYINGNEAHFQGVGTATIGGTTKTVGITGSAIDGNLSGGNGIDKVRIRIFDPLLGGQFDPGALIYDNMCTDYLGSTTDAIQPSPLCVNVFEPANDATITLGGTVGINP